jgi:hypothetical protein
MARVMISCPESRQPVYTHVSCTASEFMDLPIIEAVIKCSACGKPHRWTPADAFLDEDGGSG